MAFTCPTCKRPYADILDHIRKRHAQEAYTDLQLQPIGLNSCPICHTACRGQQGINTHIAKIHNIPGASRTSTQARERTYPIPDVPASEYTATSRKRRASTEIGDWKARRRLPTTPEYPGTPEVPEGSIEGPSEPLEPPEDLPEAIEDLYSTLNTSNASSWLQPPESAQPAAQPSQPTLEEQHQATLEPIVAQVPMKILRKVMTIPIPTQKIRPKQARAFSLAANRLAEKFNTHPTEKNLLHFLILPRILGLGLQQGNLQQLLRDFPSNLPTLQVPTYPIEDPQSTQNPVKRVKKLLEDGFLGRASKALIDTTPLATLDEATLYDLRQKHPIGPIEPFGPSRGPPAGPPVTIEAIIASIVPQAAGGHDTAGYSTRERPSNSLAATDGSAITSASRVRQGDPLGPFFFSVAYRPTLEAYIKKYPQDIVISYLDDTYILSPTTGAKQRLQQTFQHSSLRLNPQKTTAYPIAEARDVGIRALGTYMGPQAPRVAFLQGKVAQFKQVLQHLKDLPSQHALLLLRGMGLMPLYEEIDQLTLQAIQQLASQGRDSLIEVNQDLLALPARLGGLGLTLYAEMPTDHYRVAREAAIPTLEKIQPNLLSACLLPSIFDPDSPLSTLSSPSSPSSPNSPSSLPCTYPIPLLQDLSTFQKPTNQLSPIQEVQWQATQARLERLQGQLTLESYRAIATLDPQLEPKVPGAQGLRTDLATTYKGSIRYYDVQIVSINKPSAKPGPQETLREAAEAKKAKYRSLGTQFIPIIISAGGLMEKSTAKVYKDLQGLIGPVASAWMDSMISLALYRARTSASTSIARDQPPEPSWQAIRTTLRGRNPVTEGIQRTLQAPRRPPAPPTPGTAPSQAARGPPASSTVPSQASQLPRRPLAPRTALEGSIWASSS
ncbi:hypothetical protein NLG97_g2259 [Lecanicillium saksenae]|uniref:Uncharacterized protein n=1 Tax=Lecanicillium saksenae TaxID=468837 RepID=A0ACC1R441_9HYPO|nr:hypothetical protein NLG97_g2259 [Lecanicillium saksenae]